MKKKVLLMYNAISGRGNVTNDLIEGIEYLSAHNYEVTIYPIDPKDGLTSENILDSVEVKYDIILVCGGDGTLNYVINDMIRKNIHCPIGYVPVGSTNDFSKSLYGSNGHTVKDVCRYIVDGKTLTYDIGRFNDTYFNYVAGFGALPMVSYTTPQELKNNLGYGAYVLKLLSTIPDGLGYHTHCVIEHDGIQEEGDFMFGLITNSISVAGMQPGVMKNSSLDDGIFEALLIRSNLKVQDIPEILNALNHENPTGEAIVTFQLKNATFTFDKDVPWTLDGEDGGEQQTAQITVHPHKITIFAPNTEE